MASRISGHLLRSVCVGYQAHYLPGDPAFLFVQFVVGYQAHCQAGYPAFFIVQNVVGYQAH